MSRIIITIIITVIIIAGILLLTKQKNVSNNTDVLDREETEKSAREWVKDKASTYIFDGYDLSLLYAEEIKKGESYEMTFSFTSRSAGYGDRANEMTAQVITPHLIEVIVDKGEAVSVITDGVYDEIKRILIEPKTRIILVYFVEMAEGQEQITKAVREIPFTVSVGRAAIEKLLEGPSAEEKSLGLSTLIPKGTKLLGIDIQNGAARVDFNKELQKGVAGSAQVTAIRGQIEKTLLQFENVKEVVIMAEGKSEDALQP